MSTPNDVREAIALLAPTMKLPPAFVLAIAQVESNLEPFAWNPEPHYRYLWDSRSGTPFRLTPAQAESSRPPASLLPPKGLRRDKDSEYWGQRASWGPMQVMGAVAREHGFMGDFTELCQPWLGCYYGCSVLARLRRRFERRHGLEGVAAAYNAGSPRKTASGDYVNQRYVDKVRRAGGFN